MQEGPNGPRSVGGRVVPSAHGYGVPPVTVHVTTSLEDVGTVVTLRGVADEGLLAMLADGIARLVALDPRLFVDASALAQPRTPAGRALLDQLLGGRDLAGTVVCNVRVGALDEVLARR
jgi:hypothetical protein